MRANGEPEPAHGRDRGPRGLTPGRRLGYADHPDVSQQHGRHHRARRPLVAQLSAGRRESVPGTPGFHHLCGRHRTRYGYHRPDTSTPYYQPSPAASSNNYTAGTPNQFMQLGDGSWTETQPDGLAYHYPATTGEVTTTILDYVQNLAGVRWTVMYDGGNKITRIDGPFSRTTTFVYDDNAMIRRIVDPAGRITSFSVNFDDNQNLVRFITPELCLTSFLYDTDNNSTLRAWIDPMLQRTGFNYVSDEAESPFAVSQVMLPSGRLTSFLYNGDVPYATVTDGRGGVTTYISNDPGNGSSQVMAIVDALGNTTSFTYDDYQRVLSQQDPHGSAPASPTCRSAIPGSSRFRRSCCPKGAAIRTCTTAAARSPP